MDQGDQDKLNRRLSTEQQRIEDTRADANPDAEQKRLFIADAKELLGRAADARRRYDYEWMVRDLFRRGYHFSRYQPTTQTVILASKQSAKIPINLCASAMRSIRNQVTSFRPKWECLPRYTTEESKTQARYTGQFLDYIFDHLHLKHKIKETITQGLVTSVGIWRTLYDEIKKEARIWLVDPFDLYIDPYAETVDDAEYMILATRRPLSWILSQPDYDEKAKSQIVSPEARLAFSEYKQFMIQAVKNMAQYQTDRNATVILFEGEFRIWKDGKSHIRRAIWTDQNTDPLVYEDTDEEDFTYSIYQADINPKEIYGEGWMKHTMPINRVIDMLESSIYDYNHRVAKGRILVDRDAGVRAVHNVHGEVITKNRGTEVTAMDMPALPISVASQAERMMQYFEDISGAHDASLGRIPAGVKSGVGINELKQADSTNQDDLVDNLEDFLEDVARKVMKIVAKDYKTFQVVQSLGHDEQESQYFAIVGKDSGKSFNKDREKDTGKKQVRIGPDWLDLAIIGDDNNIRVTVGSWLGYTKEMMQQKVEKYIEAGIIDQKTGLQLLEFGNIDEIVQSTRKEQLLKARFTQQSAQGQAPGEQDQYTLAQVENQMLLEGKPVKPDPHDDHEVHIAVHQDALGQGADDLVGMHIKLHQQYLNAQWGTPEAASNADVTRNQQVSQQGQPGQPGGPTQQQPNQGMPPVGQGQPRAGSAVGNIPPPPAQVATSPTG